MEKGRFFRHVRIILLLLLLIFIGLNTWLSQQRHADWERRSQYAVIYPINADRSASTATFMRNLQESDFDVIEKFMANQANYYLVRQPRPIEVKLAPQVNEIPPPAPRKGNFLSQILWSLEMRYWAWSRNNYQGPLVDIKLYVIYHDPTIQTHLQHSLGIQKGSYAVIHAFADKRMSASNKFIITHEMLHIFGATDKYSLTTNQPKYPEGYAEPHKNPRLPQTRAEIMGGRIPISITESKIPKSLQQVLVGRPTAREINWVR
ncbi:MAG: hypothetical protein BMS9Abin26_1264 [Gammaproteobacteria bacterium]|nr:MAG: hypothetical protein BMS9Abin26_1264 [Gammaproteobacteria bacterium]